MKRPHELGEANDFRQIRYRFVPVRALRERERAGFLMAF